MGNLSKVTDHHRVQMDHFTVGNDYILCTNDDYILGRDSPILKPTYEL